MAIIILSTRIRAPRERVFDLSRSIDAHQASTTGTHERAIAGVTTGLIGLGGEVTWEAKHLGVTQKLSVRITAFDRPNHFQDVMIFGAFKRMVHDHRFVSEAEETVMSDRFEFESPFGIVGRMVDQLFLANYMRRFLITRNEILKQTAESDDWRRFLPDV